MKSSWLHSKQLLKIFELRKILKEKYEARSFVRSYEPDTLPLSNHINAEHLFWVLFACLFSRWASTKVVRSAKITPKETIEKDFMKVWKHYLILLLKKLNNKFLVIVQEPKKLKRKMCFFLHDQKNAPKMQMSILDHESREKYQKKRQRLETENLKITQGLSS